MKINFCPICGSKTKSIQLGDDIVSYCEKCDKYFQDFVYTCVIIIAIKDNKVAVIKQSYGVDRFVLVAGFVKPKESLEEACVREIKEELGLNATNINYISSYPMQNKENLMTAFSCNVSGDIKLSTEVKEVQFLDYKSALNKLKDASIAKKVLERYIKNN